MVSRMSILFGFLRVLILVKRYSERAELKDKPGGAFGAYGWSGEAPGRIFETMEHIYGMKMVSGPLMLKASWIGGGNKAAQDYGKSITAMI